MDYDVIIIGGGPAGLTAAIYLARSKFNTLLVEADCIGGQAARAAWLENYPGFSDGITGLDLMDKFREQAERFGTKIKMAKVEKLVVESDGKFVSTDGGETLKAKTIIISSGSRPRKLGVPGEEALTGKGVCYCATCDGPLFKDKEVAVIGGGNVAIEDALFLTRFASRVYVVHRRDEFRAIEILQEELLANDKVKIMWNSVVTEITPRDGMVDGVILKNLATGESDNLQISGLFIAIGQEPNSSFVRGVLPTDEQGYIITNDNLETDEEGIFAAGDVRKNQLKQVAVATGEGALAAVVAGGYVRKEYP